VPAEEAPAPDEGGYIKDESEPSPEPVGIYYEPEPGPPDRPDNAPEPEADIAAAPQGMPSWQEIVASLTGELKSGIVRSLGDSGIVTAQLSETAVHLTLSGGSLAARLNTPEVLGAVRAAASKLSGRKLDIEVTLTGGGKQPTRSIEELRGNPFVKFV
jgi:hypothetical protein